MILDIPQTRIAARYRCKVHREILGYHCSVFRQIGSARIHVCRRQVCRLFRRAPYTARAGRAVAVLREVKTIGLNEILPLVVECLRGHDHLLTLTAFSEECRNLFHRCIDRAFRIGGIEYPTLSVLTEYLLPEILHHRLKYSK